MSKLAWVALPLLIAAGWLLLLALAKRSPSRQALNVWTSLLLLAYLLATASLGIFWVANQQLPVFDWHYLFGYATVLLVAVHLAFNFRVVWRHLTRPRPPAAAVDLQGRRFGFAAIAALLAAGPAFFLGLRHGRSELRVEWPAGAGDARTAVPGALGLALVERFHAFSAHSRSAVLLRAPGSEWDAAPASFKEYPQAPRIALPDPRAAAATPLAALGVALWHCSGVTDRRIALNLRASPSSGALFSTELYVASASLKGLPPGVWHYEPRAHVLERVGAAPPGQPDAPAAVIATAVFQRTGRKYRDRTYRYVVADLGHALENLRVAAAATGWQAVPAAGFDEALLARQLGLDESEEGVLALVPLQRGALAPRAPAAHWIPATAAFADATPRDVTGAIHLGSSLRGAATPPPAGAVAHTALPSVAAVPTADLDIIARRRSVRRFAATSIALADLSAVLSRMAQPALLSPAVRIDLVANAVAGLAPGSYRYLPATHALAPRRAGTDLRAVAQAAALDQQVVGEAGAVFLLAIDKAAFAGDPLGPARGYRHAFLEAGMVGERVYLEAGARHLGACAVGAFYDDEAAGLAGIDPQREWVVHVTALGVPA